MRVEMEITDQNMAKKEPSLLRKLNVPLEHLDYEYVRNCTNVREIEKILRILRSGEVGRYEDLEIFVVNHMEKLQPTNMMLREEVPILTRSSLGRSEMESIDLDLLDWIHEIEKKDENNATCTCSKQEEMGREQVHSHEAPIRGTQTLVLTDDNSTSMSSTQQQNDNNSDNFIKHRKPEHIKSWEYEKWSKFNVDAELSKLDIQDMREEELKGQIETEKLNHHHYCGGQILLEDESGVEVETERTDARRNEKYGKIADAFPPAAIPFQKECAENTTKNTELGRSYIEEIPDCCCCSIKDMSEIKSTAKTTTAANTCATSAGTLKADSERNDLGTNNKQEQHEGDLQRSRRRFKIMIEDINIC